MLRKFRSKRFLALVTVGVLAISAAAVAFFTSTGSGTGSASVGTSSNVTITGTTSTSLYPAGAAVPVSIVVHNPGSGAEQIGSVTATSITADPGHSTCDVSLNSTGSAFTMGATAINQDVAAGGNSTAVNGSLQMNDTGVSQDSCQGATLTINFTSN